MIRKDPKHLFAWLRPSIEVFLAWIPMSFWLIARGSYIILDPFSLIKLFAQPINW